MLAQEGSPGVKRFVGDALQVPRGDSGDIAGGECGASVLSFLGVCPLWGEITIEKGGG
jgi:hypothetical protein